MTDNPEALCPTCMGQGWIDIGCRTCGGQGRVVEKIRPFGIDYETCPECKGSWCPDCDGTGTRPD